MLEFCFINRAGEFVTLTGTDPNDAVSPWHVRNWQNPRWSLIGMRYCNAGQCQFNTISDPGASCPAQELT
ncbi:hypothetical protein NIES4073_02810 (plasmid) [Kalymmatonema gypsitolerans NIES-4073]|nr:hypothetical protein NIES4073_02810 [Scytonema sp. NIES-4073]